MDNRGLGLYSDKPSIGRIAIPLWFLAILEAVVLFSSVYLASDVLGVLGLSPASKSSNLLYLQASSITLVMLIIMVAAGLYQPVSRAHAHRYYLSLSFSYITGLVFLSVTTHFITQITIEKPLLLLAVLFAYLGQLLMYRLVPQFQRESGKKRKVLVLGAGSRTVDLASSGNGFQGNLDYDLVGYVPQGEVDWKIDKKLVLKSDIPLMNIVKSRDIDEIVVGVRQRRGGSLDMSELLECKMEGVDITTLPRFFERELGKIPLESLNPSCFVFSNGFDRTLLRRVVKRAFDLVASFFLLILTFPLLALTAILIKLDSKGPVFYLQRRIGECGAPFNILKFRSMHVDRGGKHIPQWTQENDERVTAVGRVIRVLRIDELPQIINVVKGNMSFVGPRPEQPLFVEKLGKEIPYYSARHSVKPGITGWAQIKYPYGASIEESKEKLEYDLYYAKNHTLFLDIKILLQTVRVVLLGKGAR